MLAFTALVFSAVLLLTLALCDTWSAAAPRMTMMSAMITILLSLIISCLLPALFFDPPHAVVITISVTV